MKSHLASYISGFILSILLTVGAYFSVVNHLVTGNLLIVAILAFAIVQLIVQLIFFLRLGREPKSQLNLLFFISTVGLILVVVVGAIWIMYHLNYNMTPQQINNYLKDQDAF